MEILITVLIFIACFFLVILVLAQNSKGGGLASNFGGGSTQFMGVKKTGDLLEKLTWGFAIALLVLCLGINLLYKSSADDVDGGINSVNVERAQEGNKLMPKAPSDDESQEAAPAIGDSAN